MNRNDYISQFPSLSEAMEFETSILSIGNEFLSQEAQDVRDGLVDEPSSEYWEFLISELNSP